MGRSKQVRLSDIAERLGLSTVSISKALRGHPDISEETRALAKKTAREMGYVPNHVARSLSSKQSMTLGVVVPKIAHSFFAEALDGIHEVAAEEGYEIVLTVSRENAEAEQGHLETLLSMRVDGLLISASQQAPRRDVYARIRDMNVPLVFFDRAVERFCQDFGFSSVTVDDRGGARSVVEHAIAQGYRRVAHLAGYAHTGIGRERRAGYEEALAARGLPIDSACVVEGGFSEADGYRGFKQILSEAEAVPEAVFAATFPVGLGALDAMREAAPGLAEEVPVLAFGTHGLNRYLKRPFICVHQPARELGRRATALLLKEVTSQGGNAKASALDGRRAEHVVLPTHIVPPGSARDLPYLDEAEREAMSGSPG